MTSNAAAQEASDVTITLQGEITSYQGIMVEGNTLTYVMDSTTITVNGEALTSPAAPLLIYNQEYLPLRIIAENFGFTVNWNSATATVNLSK